jgi:predicted secreted protein
MILALLFAAAPVDVVGFSPDDRYVAWIEHGTAEGSGHPWARLHVTEVARSADAVAPVEVTLDSGKPADTEETAVKQARAAADAARGKLRVTSWTAARPVEHDSAGELSDRDGAPLGTVQIEQRPAKGKGSACEEPFRPVLLRVMISLMGDDRPRRLGEDKSVPKDRPCASTCELGGVFAHGKAVLAVIRCAVKGFEGASSKYSAYTGTLPHGLVED